MPKVELPQFLDRCRTTVNVFGDSVGAAVVGRLTERKNDAQSGIRQS